MINETDMKADDWPSFEDSDWVTVAAADAHKVLSGNNWLESRSIPVSGKMIAKFKVPTASERVRFSDLMETQRQAGLVFVHQALGVPRDRVFVLETIRLGCVSSPWVEVPDLSSGDVSVKLVGSLGTGEQTRRASLGFRLRAQGISIGYGEANVRLVPPSVFHRVRSREPEILVNNSRPQSHSSAKTFREQFLLDAHDPILSDHTSGHVPAMGVVCAVERSSCRGKRHRRLMDLSLKFWAYADLDKPTEIEINSEVNGRFSGAFVQDSVSHATFKGRREIGE